jgi:hypothetical protein
MREGLKRWSVEAWCVMRDLLHFEPSSIFHSRGFGLVEEQAAGFVFGGIAKDGVDALFANLGPQGRGHQEQWLGGKNIHPALAKNGHDTVKLGGEPPELLFVRAQEPALHGLDLEFAQVGQLCVAPGKSWNAETLKRWKAEMLKGSAVEVLRAQPGCATRERCDRGPVALQPKIQGGHRWWGEYPIRALGAFLQSCH